MRKTTFLLMLFLITPAVGAVGQTDDQQTTDTMSAEYLKLLAELNKQRSGQKQVLHDRFDEFVAELKRNENKGFVSKLYSDTRPLARPPSDLDAVAMVGQHRLTYREVQERYLQLVQEKPPELAQILEARKANNQRFLEHSEKMEQLRTNNPIVAMQLSEKMEELLSWDTHISGRLLEYENSQKLQVAVDWVDRQLLLDQARLGRMVATPQEIQQELKKLLETTLVQEDFTTYLQQQDVSYSDFLGELGEKLQIGKLLTATVEIQYSDKVLKQYYKEGMKFNKKTFEQPEKAFVIMLFKSNKDPIGALLPEAERNALRAQLGSWRNQINSTKSFVALAREHSDEPYDGERSILGWINKGAEIVQEETGRTLMGDYLQWSALEELSLIYRQLNRLCFKQKVGKLSQVLETDAGYHLVLLTDRIPPMGHNFKTARKTIVMGLVENMRTLMLLQLREARWEEVMVDFRGVDSPATLLVREARQRYAAALNRARTGRRL